MNDGKFDVSEVFGQGTANNTNDSWRSVSAATMEMMRDPKIFQSIMSKSFDRLNANGDTTVTEFELFKAATNTAAFSENERAAATVMFKHYDTLSRLHPADAGRNFDKFDMGYMRSALDPELTSSRTRAKWTTIGIIGGGLLGTLSGFGGLRYTFGPPGVGSYVMLGLMGVLGASLGGLVGYRRNRDLVDMRDKIESTDYFKLPGLK